MEATHTKIREWFKRSHKLVKILNYNPTQKIDTIKQHRTTIEEYLCPKCGNKNLKVQSLQEGTTGWQAHVNCTRCNSKITLNDTGFQINFNDGTKQ